VQFAKGHGTGNDFVVLPDVADELTLTPALVRALCDRRTGIGADGVLRVVRGDSGRWFMDHHNADGSIAEMCGNGIRLYARWLVDAHLAAPGELVVETRGGPKRLQVPTIGDVTVDMGTPTVSQVPHTVHAAGSRAGIAIDMGNPHVVARVVSGELATLDLTLAPRVEPPFPQGVNVELIELTGPSSLRLRVHERGVGETASCGTGACAAVVAAARWAGWDPSSGPAEWDVAVPGGDLVVTWTGQTLLLRGPAEIVATGEVHLAALHANAWSAPAARDTLAGRGAPHRGVAPVPSVV